MGIDNMSNLKCWGENHYGQLGDSLDEDWISTPTIIPLYDNDDNLSTAQTSFATQLSLGPYYSCVIDNKNNIRFWGHDHYAMLADGGTVMTSGGKKHSLSFVLVVVSIQLKFQQVITNHVSSIVRAG